MGTGWLKIFIYGVIMKRTSVLYTEIILSRGSVLI